MISLDSFRSNSNNREVNQRFLRNVFKVVADKKASYPSEVKYFVDTNDINKIAKVMRELEDVGIFERLKPKMKNADPRLRSASYRTGKNSMDKMKQPKWYGLNSEHDWYLKDDNLDHYVNEYGDKVENKSDQSATDFMVERLENEGMM